jgi:hypothetical protein
MTLLMGMVGLWAALIAARGTPVGETLNRWLLAKPAAALSRIHRQTMLAAAMLIVTALAAWWVIGHEGILIYSMALPELTAALAMIDLGVMLDIALVVVTGAASSSWRAIRALLPQRAAPRSPRARRTRTPRKPAANDDGDGPALAQAA